MADLIVEDGTIVTGANSYCTIDDADLYFEKRLHTSSWDNADFLDKEKALMWATRLLDEHVNWHGFPLQDLQPLRFPRDGLYNADGDSVGGATIPQFLKDATTEFALHLITEDRTLETNRDMTGLKRVKVDTIEIETEPKLAMTTTKALIPPSVWSMIRFYGSSYTTKRRLVRV